jgi:hypothetical protein
VARSLDSTGPVTLATESPRLPWRATLLMYLSFVAGVVLATWPLARHPATHWPQHHDPALFTWVMVSMSTD